MRVLTVSGSLRGQSTNTELLRALRLVASSDISVTLSKALRHCRHSIRTSTQKE
jgi:NAD(P)H-dependent FMN reductase